MSATFASGLLNELETNPQEASFPDDMIADLKDCERVLEALKESGIGWHFSTDF